MRTVVLILLSFVLLLHLPPSHETKAPDPAPAPLNNSRPPNITMKVKGVPGESWPPVVDFEYETKGGQVMNTTEAAKEKESDMKQTEGKEKFQGAWTMILFVVAAILAIVALSTKRCVDYRKQRKRDKQKSKEAQEAREARISARRGMPADVAVVEAQRREKIRMAKKLAEDKNVKILG